MKVIECRSCGAPHRIKTPLKDDKEYPNKIRCIECWSKSGKSFSSVKIGGNKGFITDKDTGNKIETTYEVGDSVFVNTDKYGVLLCQILDVECWNDGEHTFYAVDAKGTIVDYVEEEEVYNSAEEAQAGHLIKVF